MARRQIDIMNTEKQKVAICYLEEGDSTVEFEGEKEFVAKLQAGVRLSAKDTVKPEDGDKFLDALLQKYRSAYLYAVEINNK